MEESVKAQKAPVIGKAFTPEFTNDKKFDTERSELIPEQEDIFIPKPTKKVMRIKPISVLSVIILVFLLEIFILTGCIYLLVPLAINIKVTYINALCSSLLLAVIKKWWTREGE